MLYQIEMINNQYVFFTIDRELLEFLITEEGMKKRKIIGWQLQFPTYILRNNEVHFRHWTVRRRLKNLRELGDTFTTTGMNLDYKSHDKSFSCVYTFY